MIKKTQSQWMKLALLGGVLLAAMGASAQTNEPAASNRIAAAQYFDPAAALRAEQLRTVCIQERRCICGRVLAVETNGLVIDSGYASLLRGEAAEARWQFDAAAIERHLAFSFDRCCQS